MSEYKDTIILTIIALISALNLGVLNYYKNSDALSIQPLLISIAKIIVAIILAVFFFYLIVLGISKVYQRPILKEMHPILYDIGIAITIIIVLITLVFGFSAEANKIIYVNIGIAILTGIIMGKKLFDEYKEHVKS